MEKTIKITKDIELYGKLFTYNPFKKLWYSGTSEDLSKLANGYDNSCLSATTIVSLISKVKSKK